MKEDVVDVEALHVHGDGISRVKVKQGELPVIHVVGKRLNFEALLLRSGLHNVQELRGKSLRGPGGGRRWDKRATSTK